LSTASFTRRRPRREPATWPYYVVLSGLAAFALGPLVVLVFNSLKSAAERGRNPLGPPTDPIFNNFPRAWDLANFSTTMKSSMILTVGTVVGVWIISGLASYALARLALPGGASVLVYLLVGSALPVQLFLIPLFFLWVKLGLIDSLVGLIIIYCALFSPFATLLLRSYFVTIPLDFEEAARVDGANELQVLTRIVLPLAWPGFLTVGLVTGLATWNEFFFAVTFIQREELMPVTTSFLAFQQGFTRDWGLTSAAGLIMIVPVLALFLALQRRFIAGLTTAGLKG
jgi:raffinose/stachyose/melibiose transport system permease protein